MTTYWKCERCGHHGVVRYEKHASVYDVLYRLEDAHNARAGSECSFSTEHVRVSETPFAAAPSQERAP